MIVDIFIPCFIDQIYPNAGLNMVRVLEKVGCDVNYNPEQTCCGQPAFNAGFWEEAKVVGEKFIKEFQNDRYIVCPSASCVGMIKNYYPEMFHNSALHNEYKQLSKNIHEFSSFLVNIMKVTDVGAKLDGIGTYHDSCAALRECNVKQEPRTLLKNVRGLEIVEMKDTETCCGFGGTFSSKFESISVGMGSDKVKHALDTGAQYLISTDASCLLHMEGYIKKQNKDLTTMHLADVLASGWE
ncbi:MAG TPA: (Fe-S)-binding protein [Bacteroidia bacterium]|jgi:L-lactate dehydrogenase complex protein LldE|nr:(Fe-S)-binding protein [Bacteroidia bacterium]